MLIDAGTILDIDTGKSDHIRHAFSLRPVGCGPPRQALEVRPRDHEQRDAGEHEQHALEEVTQLRVQLSNHGRLLEHVIRRCRRHKHQPNKCFHQRSPIELGRLKSKQFQSSDSNEATFAARKTGQLLLSHYVGDAG